MYDLNRKVCNFSMTMHYAAQASLTATPVARMRLSSQPSPFDWNDTVGFIIQADDRISVNILRLADEFVHNEFTPIVLEWYAIRGVPSGGGLYLTDRIENATALDDVG